MQTYHSNAKINASHRTFFQANKNRLSNAELAQQFNVSTQTIDKWENRVTTKDLSSCRKSIRRSYSQWKENLVVCIRNLTQ